jgi:pimeloyl-ACP methyl ester carboxylesterase
MKNLDLGDARIAYSDEGEGDGVLLLHGAFSGEGLAPVGRLLAQSGFRVLRVHRAGYGQSTDLTDGAGVEVQVEHAIQVLEAEGVGRVDVVAHSTGSCVALQLALARPDLVRSLVLLEPAFPASPDEPDSVAMAEAFEMAGKGEFERAFDLLCEGMSGAGFREAFRRELGEEGLREAIAGSRYFFTAEGPAFAAWSFDAEDAAAVAAPVLLVVGGEGERLRTPHGARSAQLASWLRNARTSVLPGLTHSMALEDPKAVMNEIEQFVDRQRG